MPLMTMYDGNDGRPIAFDPSLIYVLTSAPAGKTLAICANAACRLVLTGGVLTVLNAFGEEDQKRFVSLVDLMSNPSAAFIDPASVGQIMQARTEANVIIGQCDIVFRYGFKLTIPANVEDVIERLTGERPNAPSKLTLVGGRLGNNGAHNLNDQ